MSNVVDMTHEFDIFNMTFYISKSISYESQILFKGMDCTPVTVEGTVTCSWTPQKSQNGIFKYSNLNYKNNKQKFQFLFLGGRHSRFDIGASLRQFAQRNQRHFFDDRVLLRRGRVLREQFSRLRLRRKRKHEIRGADSRNAGRPNRRENQQLETMHEMRARGQNAPTRRLRV